MPTLASVLRRASAIRRDSVAASAGWPGEVQMPGAVAAEAAAGVLAGLGVLAGTAVLAGFGVLAGAGARTGAAVLAGALTGAGAAVEPEISRAESPRAYQGHRPRRRIVITLLGQRKTLGSQAGVTMSSSCEEREGFCRPGSDAITGARRTRS
jgi:hypothetical protein